MKTEQPASYEEAADLLRGAAADGRRLRFRGGGTKLGWGRPVPEPDLEVCTGGLDRVLEHNAGDFTAVLQAGVPLAVAQEAFASAGQMLALDPPLSPWGSAGDDAAIEAAGAGATIGGIVATNDSGPLRHRYGGVRDLVVGVTVVLSDGTIAKAGGKVIKNVAGYDLGKLYAGAFGTLGLIAEVIVRLHPAPARTATVVARSADPAQLAAAASALSHAPLEADCLDLWWDASTGTAASPNAAATSGAATAGTATAGTATSGTATAGTATAGTATAGTATAGTATSGTATSGTATAGTATAGAGGSPGAGAVLARFGSADPGPRVEEAAALLRNVGGLSVDIDTDDAACWEAQRAAQRGDLVVKVSALPAALPAAMAVTQALGGTLVARAGHGLAWIHLPTAPSSGRTAVAAVEELRGLLAPAPCVVLDAPAEVRAALDPWGGETGPVELMRKVKERFDPAGVCAPGLFVGGI